MPIELGRLRTFVNVRCRRVPRARGTVICAHGIGASGAEFALLADQLNDLGASVVCPDWLGHGDSDHPRVEAAYGWEQYVKTLWRVYRRYGGEATHYVGVSWGAFMMLLVLLSRELSPASAIFVDLALRSRPALLRSYERLTEQYAHSFDSIEQAESFLYSRRPELAHVPEAMREYYRAARFTRRGGKIVFKCDPMVLEAARHAPEKRYNHLHVLRRINFPAQFVYGARSPYREAHVFSVLCRRMRNISYVDDLESGHPPALLKAEEIVPIVNFIAPRLADA